MTENDTFVLGLPDIQKAERALAPHIVQTPLLESPRLNALCGGRVLVKAECLQKTGSFKIRGALNKLSLLTPAQRRQGVVAFSSGNHGQGVAAAARLFGVEATVFMPGDSPRVKLESVRFQGAKVVLYDRQTEDREALAAQWVARTGAILVHPFDDPDVMAGQGTIGLELARQVPLAEVHAVLVPAGGGGLIAGIASALSACGPSPLLYAVEPAACDDTARSLAAAARLSNAPGSHSICDALLTPSPGVRTFAVNRRLLAGGLVVSDDEVAAAMAVAFSTLKLVLEPGGAVALAAALRHRELIEGRTTVVIASGGNVDAATYARILQS